MSLFGKICDRFVYRTLDLIENLNQATWHEKNDWEYNETVPTKFSFYHIIPSKAKGVWLVGRGKAQHFITQELAELQLLRYRFVAHVDPIDLTPNTHTAEHIFFYNPIVIEHLPITETKELNIKAYEYTPTVRSLIDSCISKSKLDLEPELELLKSKEEVKLNHVKLNKNRRKAVKHSKQKSRKKKKNKHHGKF